jgi:large subunit ribosomal protein L4
MITVSVYNLEGKPAGEMNLDEALFGVELNLELVQHVAVAQRANAFIPYAHTKGRSDVRGGGKKPWKQKGTGQARHGSIRSPLWRGGGITFGPTSERNMNKKVNNKERRKALRMVLSNKTVDKALIVVDSFDGLTGKTKELATLLATLPTNGRSVLIASAQKNDVLRRATNNLEQVNTILADSINVGDLLTYQYLVVDKAGVETITERFK